jgi:hypothetical protein
MGATFSRRIGCGFVKEFNAMKKFSMTRQELEDFAVHALGFQRKALRRMSTLFLTQLLQMNLSGEEGAEEMVDEITCLEDRCQGLSPNDGPGPGNRKQSDAWVVFKRYNGSNYYLTLANTGEGEGNINRRLQDVYAFDFPFLEEKHRLN